MNAAHFTPGSWHRAGHRQIVAPGGLPIAEVFSGAVGTEQADANEHLIAAAPDLFLAAQTALVVVSNCNADHAFDVQERTIRNALSRAIGTRAERWVPALFLSDKRVLTLPETRSETDAMRAAEAAACGRHDVEWLAVKPATTT